MNQLHSGAMRLDQRLPTLRVKNTPVAIMKRPTPNTVVWSYSSKGAAFGRGMVGLEGVEPPTNGLGNRCSIHLSYRPVWHILAEAAPVSDSAIAVPYLETPFGQLLTPRCSSYYL
jgi:hypothetical protein